MTAHRESGTTHWVGRNAELDAARQVLTRRGSVVVRGEAGVGKTALAERAVRSAGLSIVTVRCFRSLSRVPAAALQLALTAPMPVGDALWTAEWLRRHLAGRALLADDLQWADDMTIAVVGHLVGRVPLAATVRAGDEGSHPVMAAVKGAERIDLAPLPDVAATALARLLHPALRVEEAQALALRCGGNPLLIEHVDGADRIDIGRSVLGRLHRCGQEATTGFSMLVLADEPLPAHWVPAATTLAEAGLVTADGGLVRPRHALLAHVIAEDLASDDRRDGIRRRVADLARGEGRADLAARMYAATQDRVAARECAALAAERAVRPGERAEMLYLAAVYAEPGEADGLVARAVSELVAAGDYGAAAALMERSPARTDPRWLALVGRVRWEAGDGAGTLAAYEAGLAQPSAGPEVDVTLRSRLAVALGITGGDLDRAAELATEAVAIAERHRTERCRAWCALGTVGYFRGSPEHLVQLRRAVELAETEDPDARFTAVNNLASALEASGESGESAAIARAASRAAEDLRLRGWAHQLAAMAVNALMHRGEYGEVLVLARTILDGVSEPRTRDQVEGTLATALIDLGRLDEARGRLDRALHATVDDAYGRGSFLWLLAEERLWSGQYAEAARLADEAMTLLPGALRHFGALTAMLAGVRGGLGVVEYDLEPFDLPLLNAITAELAGIRSLAARDPSARSHFQEAARRWAGGHRRGELRARWLAADAAPFDGPEAEAARAELLDLEQLLSAEGWLPLLGQVRRSLRERGVRRAAARGRSGDLTLREREIVDLIGQGLSNEAIAVRLGLSPATVAAQVASARARLGASSRWQAASEG